MADLDLLTSTDNEISNINFILGVRSAYCIPETEVLFGKSMSSVFSLTDLGVMLKGSVNTLKNDIPF